MYENTRMFYNNFLARTTTLTTAPYIPEYQGIVTGVIRNSAGYATCYLEAVFGYTGHNPLFFTIKIDNVTPGKEIGQATFKWRTNETSGAWEETGHATSLSPHQLENGVYVRWAAGTGNDFELNDTWSVFGRNPYSVYHLLDEHRDTIFMVTSTGGGTNPMNASIVWDLGSAGRVRCAALLDFLYPNGTVDYVRISAGTTSACSNFSADFDATLTTPVLYFDETYRYWSLKFYDADTTTSSKQAIAGQFFLGDYVELPAGAMCDWGSADRLVSEIPDSALFDYPRRIVANRRELTLNWADVSTDHRAIFDNLFAAARQNADGMEHPVFVHLSPNDDGETLYWMKLVSDLDREWTSYGRDSLTLQFREVAANYAL